MATISEVASRRWQIVEAGEIKWKNWGRERLVYHSGTSDVHLLNPLVADVLESLQTGHRSFDELLNEFAAPDDLFGEISGVKLEDVIRQLNALSLIEPCPL